MQIEFRLAALEDVPSIWNILQEAILRRKLEGSNQWQDGYPNEDSIRTDIDANQGYVLTVDGEVAAYSAVMINQEPAYDSIDGEWLSDGDFVVFHRVAISNKFAGQRLSYKLLAHIEDLAKTWQIASVRADTNFDNKAMLRIFERCGYTYCGEVLMRGSPRRAFEKLLD